VHLSSGRRMRTGSRVVEGGLVVPGRPGATQWQRFIKPWHAARAPVPRRCVQGLVPVAVKLLRWDWGGPTPRPLTASDAEAGLQLGGQDDQHDADDEPLLPGPGQEAHAALSRLARRSRRPEEQLRARLPPELHETRSGTTGTASAHVTP